MKDSSKVSFARCTHLLTRKTSNELGQLNPASHFVNDLGLDSLDTVEVVMAIEEVGMLLANARPPLTSIF